MKRILITVILFFSFVVYSLAIEAEHPILGALGKPSGELMEIMGTVLPREYKNKIKFKVTGSLVKVEKVDGKKPKNNVVVEIVFPESKANILLKHGQKYTCKGYEKTTGAVQKITGVNPAKMIYFKLFYFFEPPTTEQTAAPDGSQARHP